MSSNFFDDPKRRNGYSPLFENLPSIKEELDGEQSMLEQSMNPKDYIKDYQIKKGKDGKPEMSITTDPESFGKLMGKAGLQGPEKLQENMEGSMGLKARAIMGAPPEKGNLLQRMSDAFSAGGGATFDRRAGFGNVVGILGAMARGGPAVKRDYENRMQQYSLQLSDLEENFKSGKINEQMKFLQIRKMEQEIEEVERYRMDMLTEHGPSTLFPNIEDPEEATRKAMEIVGAGYGKMVNGIPMVSKADRQAYTQELQANKALHTVSMQRDYAALTKQYMEAKTPEDKAKIKEQMGPLEHAIAVNVHGYDPMALEVQRSISQAKQITQKSDEQIRRDRIKLAEHERFQVRFEAIKAGIKKGEVSGIDTAKKLSSMKKDYEVELFDSPEAAASKQEMQRMLDAQVLEIMETMEASRAENPKKKKDEDKPLVPMPSAWQEAE